MRHRICSVQRAADVSPRARSRAADERCYPELSRAQALITETLKLEERGSARRSKMGSGSWAMPVSTLSKGAVFPGDVAFKLYDTYASRST